jgi:hypothetical protein
MLAIDLPNVSMQDYQVSKPRPAYAAPYGKVVMDWKEYTVTSPLTSYNQLFECELARFLTIKEFTLDNYVVTGYGMVLARACSFTQAMQVTCNILAALDGGLSVFSLEYCQ